jgi:hypothetical protein
MGRVHLWYSVKLVAFNNDENSRWPELLIRFSDDDIRVRIGANPFLPKEGNYGRDALIAKVEALSIGDVVDIWVHESPWIAGDKSGVIYYMQDIRSAN